MDAAPQKSALLVIDVQRAVLVDAADESGVVERINGLLERARDEGTTIVFIQHEQADDPDLAAGNPGWEFVAELDVRPDDTVVPKTYRDSFAETTLESILSASGITRLVVTGAQSDYCVNTTAHSALQHGFDVTLVSDGHTTCSSNAGGVDAASVIQFINGHFETLRHPDRRVEVVPASGVVF